MTVNTARLLATGVASAQARRHFHGEMDTVDSEQIRRVAELIFLTIVGEVGIVLVRSGLPEDVISIGEGLDIVASAMIDAGFNGAIIEEVRRGIG